MTRNTGHCVNAQFILRSASVAESAVVSAGSITKSMTLNDAM